MSTPNHIAVDTVSAGPANIRAAAEQTTSTLRRSARRMDSLLRLWLARNRRRRLERKSIRMLRGLSDDALKDIGLSRSSIRSAVRERLRADA